MCTAAVIVRVGPRGRVVVVRCRPKRAKVRGRCAELHTRRSRRRAAWQQLAFPGFGDGRRTSADAPAGQAPRGVLVGFGWALYLDTDAAPVCGVSP